MYDPNADENDKEMNEGALLIERLEKDTVPADAVELHEPLCGWKVH
jgi:hypothetical protein